MYHMLLQRKITTDSEMLVAVPVEREAVAPEEAPSPDVNPTHDTRSTIKPVTGTPATGVDSGNGNPMAPQTEVFDPNTEVSRHTAGIGLRDGESLGPYRIERILGQGGMGTVYEAFDTSLHRTVALKVLSDEHARNREVVDRFQREARAAGSLTHPNITHIYSIGAERGYHYFAMELVIGRTLSQVLQSDRSLDDARAADYLLQVARGLRAAKQKEIIHRDIKPSNLILSQDGLIKITDFGLAKVVTSSIDITATGVIVGTPLYMSPEQGKGEPLDHRSDIYSLGCTFYHLVSGRPPFMGDSAMNIIVRHITEEPPSLDTVNGDTSSKLAKVVARMMRKHVMDRFQTYEELIDAVSEATGTANSSSRLEATPKRIVIVSEREDERIPDDSMSRKQLSVADVNLELGRHDKALSLYQRVLDENPHLEVDLSFRMLQIYQEQGEEEAAQELYRRILQQTDDPKERFFCRWKLLSRNYEQSLVRVRQARELLEELLEDELPSPVQEKGLVQRLDHLKQMEKKLSRDRDAGIMLIRKAGDLQIELD